MPLVLLHISPLSKHGSCVVYMFYICCVCYTSLPMHFEPDSVEELTQTCWWHDTVVHHEHVQNKHMLQSECQLNGVIRFGWIPVTFSCPLLSLGVFQPGDKKLAHSAQMYHYQHQKQQMLSLEKWVTLGAQTRSSFLNMCVCLLPCCLSSPTCPLWLI